MKTMSKTKPKRTEGDASFEKYARAIQGDIARLAKAVESGFAAMATKEDLASVRTELKHDILEVGEHVDRVNSIMVSKAELAEAIRREFDAAPYAKSSELKELRQDLNRVFEKLGMKPTRRAV